MKKEIIKGTRRGMLVVYLCFWFGCQDFLETEPYGTSTFEKLSANESGANVLLIAAYSNLDGVSSQAWHGSASNWIFGSILGGDAYTGSTPGDQPEIEYIETYERLVPANIYIELKWVTYYNGIARCNEAIKAFNSLSGKDYSNRLAEARFLRGLYHFELYKIYRHVPFIDETLKDTRIGNQVDILPRIQDDFLYASTYLPPQQSQPGRVTKGAAHSFLGITKMWQENFEEAKEQFDIVIQSGIYELNSKYHDNFDADLRTSTTYVNKESILEVQQSVNDGGQGFNGNYGDVLNYVYGGPGGCCGFHQPSQNLVNAFKTDAQGLPLLDNYNDEDVFNDDGIESSEDFTPDTRNLDPRLDWTVGRRGIPYLDWGKHIGKDWIRNQIEYGPYSPKKYTLHKAQQENFSDKTGWTAGLPNVNNLKLLRYADILLYAAEAEIELGNLETAREYVNQVRRRAANKEGFVKDESGNDAANYVINEYASFADENYARKAVRFERRLELGMEGHRFFDLVRWGVAAEEKTAYFEKEKNNRYYLQTAEFVKDKHELMPIPKAAILLSYKDGAPTLTQNNGYN